MAKEKDSRLETYDERMSARVSEEQDVRWHSPDRRPFRLTGFPWFDREKTYRRMPSSPEVPLPEAVRWLAGCTAGGQLRFRTDSRAVHVRVRLKAGSDMYHMAPVAQCGFDAYIGDPGEERFAGTASFRPGEIAYRSPVCRFQDRKLRSVTLYFPLYQMVEELEIGLEDGAAVEEPAPYRVPGRILFYGTSITQGACASRPGMAYPAILGRRLGMETVNLGFSGSGKGEAEVAEAIRTIDGPACLVLDYEANCGDLGLLSATLPVFIRTYRERRPDVPILAVSRIKPPAAAWDAELDRMLQERREFQRSLVKRFREEGDERIFFLDGYLMLGEGYAESTVDGTHPTDYGFMLMADGMEPALRHCLDAGGSRLSGS